MIPQLPLPHLPQASSAGARAYGASETDSGRMRLARFPNAAADVPTAADWAGITSVDNVTLTVAAFTPKLQQWKAEMAAGTDAWTHGLWTWNWADSHRVIASIDSAGFTVAADDIGRDVSPIHRHVKSTQGGYLYAYNLLSELDVAGEYFIDKVNATLSFLPPLAATKRAAGEK